MADNKMIDHLFRHQYGKMVAILTRIFGLSHLQMIEDAVQDTFILALKKWRNQMPENPEAWLTKAAKNRAIDLLRKIKADETRIQKLNTGPSSIALNNLFLDNEIEDSQLRMIFTACHPLLNPQDQIAFALKTISGFSIKEIAAALLSKESTIKKRLMRARKEIATHSISFEVPPSNEIPLRLNRALEVIYLIFNEGFHSLKKENLVKKELCGEAIRLCTILLKKENYRNSSSYGLFSLMCLHAARLESKINADNEILDLKNQDRSLWHAPLIQIGNDALGKSWNYPNISSYQIEAAIALQHTSAASFEETDWEKILALYEQLCKQFPSPFSFLNKAIVLLQLQKNDLAFEIFQSIEPKSLEQRSYLYYGALASYYQSTNQIQKAIESFDLAITMVNNEAEKAFLLEKRNALG